MAPAPVPDYSQLRKFTFYCDNAEHKCDETWPFRMRPHYMHARRARRHTILHHECILIPVLKTKDIDHFSSIRRLTGNWIWTSIFISLSVSRPTLFCFGYSVISVDGNDRCYRRCHLQNITVSLGLGWGLGWGFCLSAPHAPPPIRSMASKNTGKQIVIYEPSESGHFRVGLHHTTHTASQERVTQWSFTIKWNNLWECLP